MLFNSTEPQPAKLEIVRRRMSQRYASQEIGVSETYLAACLNGRVRPSPRIIDGLVKLLELPADRLFRPDALKPLSRFPGNEALDGSGNAA